MAPAPSRASIRFHGLTPDAILRRSTPLCGVVRSLDRVDADLTVVTLLDIAVASPAARAAYGISEVTFLTSSEEGTAEHPALHKIQVRLSGAFIKLPVKVDDIVAVFGRDLQIVEVDPQTLIRGDHPFAVRATSFSFGDVVVQMLPVTHHGGQPVYDALGGWVEYGPDPSGMSLKSKSLAMSSQTPQQQQQQQRGASAAATTSSSTMTTTTTTTSKQQGSEAAAAPSSSSNNNNNSFAADFSEFSSPKKKARHPQHAYVTLNTLSPGKADVYGIIVGFSSPKPTSAGELRLEYQIIDESVNVNSPIQVTMFKPRMELFPDVKVLGDIIRIHRAEVGSFSGRTSLSINKLRSTVVVTSGTLGDFTSRFCKGDKIESATEMDFDRVEQLRRYAVANLWVAPAAAAGGGVAPNTSQWYLGGFYKSLGDIAASVTGNNPTKENYVDTLVKIVELKRIYGEYPRIVTVCDGSVLPGSENEVRFDMSFWRPEDWDQVQNYYLGMSMVGSWVRVRNFVASRSPRNEFELKFNESKSVCGLMRIPLFFQVPDEMRVKRLARQGARDGLSSEQRVGAGATSTSNATTTTTTSGISENFVMPQQQHVQMVTNSATTMTLARTSNNLIALENLALSKPGEIPKRTIISNVTAKFSHLKPFSVAQIVTGATGTQAPWRCMLQYVSHAPHDVRECFVPSTSPANMPQCRLMMQLCDHTGCISGMFVGTEASHFFRFEDFTGVLDEDTAVYQRLSSALELIQHPDCFLDMVLFPLTMAEGLFDVRGVQLCVTGLAPVM